MPRTSHVTTKKPARNGEKVIGSNAGKHWRKITRRDQPSKSRHAGCPGCEYCNNIVRNAACAAGFADEWEGAARYGEYYSGERDDYLDSFWEDVEPIEPYEPYDDHLDSVREYDEPYHPIDDYLDSFWEDVEPIEPYEPYAFYCAYGWYFELEDCWQEYHREGGWWGWAYLPPTERELAEDLKSLDDFNDTYTPTYAKEMAPTTRKPTRRPQAPKDKRISRDRAAKKRAMHLARKAEAEALYAPTSVDSPRTIIKGWDTWDKAIEADKTARRQARIDAFLLAEGRADIEPEMTFEVIDDAAYDEPFEDENLCICYGPCAYSDWTVHPSYDDVHQLALDEIENDMHYDDFVKCVQEDDEDTDPNPVYDFGGYLKYNGVFLLKEGMGYGLDGVFGDAGANCGFSVTRRP